MVDPSLAETSAFVAVLEQKSFSKAAKYLNLSPPRVSEMLRQLEERLGVRLVERTTRSVAPTVAGERLLARLRPVLEDYRDAFDLVNDFRDKPAGTVRLTVAPPVASLGLVSNISRFLVAYPEISVEISADSSLTDIVAGRFDAGIRHAERLERDMIAVRVSDEVPVVTVAAPSYVARHGRPQTPHELASHDCIRISFRQRGPHLMAPAGEPARRRGAGRGTLHRQRRSDGNAGGSRRRGAAADAAQFGRERPRGQAPGHRARRFPAAASCWFLFILPQPPADQAGVKVLVDFLRKRDKRA